jgi:hypothetical protein
VTLDERPSGSRLGQFGLGFAIVGILVGGGMLAVILVWLHALANGFD